MSTLHMHPHIRVVLQCLCAEVALSVVCRTVTGGNTVHSIDYVPYVVVDE